MEKQAQAEPEIRSILFSFMMNLAIFLVVGLVLGLTRFVVFEEAPRWLEFAGTPFCVALLFAEPWNAIQGEKTKRQFLIHFLGYLTLFLVSATFALALQK